MNENDIKSSAKDKNTLHKENTITEKSVPTKESNLGKENDRSSVKEIEENSEKNKPKNVKELQKRDFENLNKNRINPKPSYSEKKDEAELTIADDSKLKSWKKFLWIILSVVILVLLGIGYIQYSNVEKSHTVEDTLDANDYSVLIDQWNESVIKAKLKDNYLLPRDDNNQMIEKLNTLLAGYFSEGKHKEACLQDRKANKLYIPLNDYCDFVSVNTFAKQIHFTPKVNEAVIISTIKTTAKQEYIDQNMLMHLAYLNDFSIYFKKNLKEFYKKGFSRNIKTYSQYKELIYDTDKK